MNRDISVDDDKDNDRFANNCSNSKRQKIEINNYSYSIDHESSPKNESTNHMVDFLFRSPVIPKGNKKIFDEVEHRISYIYEVVSKGGYDAFQKLKYAKNEYKILESVHRRQKRLASLDDAVVKGDPRSYQLSLLECAKIKNTIIHLATGKGKTLIALLLIRHFSHMFEYGKQTIFLVPSVALATQHTITLEANLPYTVATANHNSMRNEVARDSFAKANILVATHGALKHLLMHYGDMFNMRRVNLCIVDECHYTHGEHGYAHIMKNFYHSIPKGDRPRVLGLVSVEVRQPKMYFCTVTEPHFCLRPHRH